MMQAPTPLCLRALRALLFTPPKSCSRRCFAAQANRPRPPPPPPPSPLRPAASTPSSPRILADSLPGYQKRNRKDDDEEFMPQPLSRPIGMPNPPQPGENIGLDRRSLAQRRDDFVDYDKHLERRSKMTKQIAKPYFRDWSNLRFHKGKIFKSNERLFRGDASLWFPNFYGTTLRADATARFLEAGDGYKGYGRDTCAAMQGKVSVVSIVSSMWASGQVDTFTSAQQNPELHRVLGESGDVAQMVWINHENNFLKWWLLQMFRNNLRAGKTTEEQGRYFMVRRGVSDVMKEAIGMLNDKIGYVYLVDPECRIRWAGSAEAEPSERESLVRGLGRLVQEARTPKEKRVDARQQLEEALADIIDEPEAAARG